MEIDMRYAQVTKGVSIALEHDVIRLFKERLNPMNQLGVLDCMYSADQIAKNNFIGGILLVLSTIYSDSTKKQIDSLIEENSFEFYLGKSFSEIGLDTVEKIYNDYDKLYKVLKPIYLNTRV